MTRTNLVFIILRNAPMEVSRVTMCGFPVHASVIVMTGHEKARNSSKDEKRGPQERSYLLEELHAKCSFRDDHEHTKECCRVESIQCKPNRPLDIV